MIPLGLLVAGGAVLVAIAAGGDDKANTGNPHGIPVQDPDPSLHIFRIGAEPSRFAGPAPLTVKFAAKPFQGSGNVKYYWTFDDGYTSQEQNPVHTFKEPGYYLIGADAIDSKKQNFGTSIYIGVWPAKTWKLSRQGKTNPIVEARKNQRRTARRKREGAKACQRDPDCRERDRVAKRADRERREKLRAGCLADPACRARNKAAAKELKRTQKALAELKAREREEARRAARRALREAKKQAERESRAR